MKKATFFLSILFLLSFGAYSQNSGWETGINLSGGASSYIITNFKNNSDYNPSTKPKPLKPAFYYSGAVYGRKFFKEMYGLEIGLQYASFGLNSIYEFNYNGSVYDPTIGYPGDPVSVKDNSRVNYLEIPIHFVFKKDLKKFGVGFFAGLSPSLLLFSYSTTIITTTANGAKTDRNKNTGIGFNLMADIGLLLRANITPRFAIDTKPFFRITPLQINPASELRFLSTGISASAVWKF